MKTFPYCEDLLIIVLNFYVIKVSKDKAEGKFEVEDTSELQ